MRDGSGASLVPSISSTAWEAGIATRIVLFQDWGPESSEESIRYAGVLKAGGILGPSNGGLGRVVPFTIREVIRHFFACVHEFLLDCRSRGS